MDHQIPEKANRVLNIIILGFLLIVIRVWYLAVIQHDEHLEKARKPRRRTVIEKVERATIRDRFNIPLALNKIQYNAAVCYADIRQIPGSKWVTNSEGKRMRVPVRADYINTLSQLLADRLHMDAQKIEDTIHGKASLFPHTPFVLKEDLSEEEYFQIKMLEKDWPGIQMEQGSKRYYPLGKIGADVIGYMGAISSKEYYAIAQELKILQEYLSQREAGEIAVLPKGFHNPLEVRERVKELQEKAYTINDFVGKAGVEARFDLDLHGYAGKRIYEVDTKGNLLRELPGGRKSVAGQRHILTISAELQQKAEQLLAQDEQVREIHHLDGSVNFNTPFIKGGAIVAMDPNTGEILALASYPRIDPNDFIPSRAAELNAEKQASVIKWLENEAYIGEIWDGKRPLDRERFDSQRDLFFTEAFDLTLERYLETILSPYSQIAQAMKKIETVGAALALQEEIQTLLHLSSQSNMATLIEALYPESPHISSKGITSERKKEAQISLLKESATYHAIRVKVDPLLASLTYNNDKLLLIDLCRMLADKDKFTPSLIQTVSSLSLKGYRLLNQSAAVLEHFLQNHFRSSFHNREFQQWRKTYSKEYLKQKRKEERQKKQYAKPYTEYLDQIEKKMFKEFWQEHRFSFLLSFIQDTSSSEISELRKKDLRIQSHADQLKHSLSLLSQEMQLDFLKTMRCFEELNHPLYGRYRSLRHTKGVQLEKHLAAAFYPLAGYGYGRSQAFRQSTPQGSVYKLVVAYQGLLERYQKLQKEERQFDDLNPLTLVDNLKWHAKPGSPDQVLGYTLDGQPIKRMYKGGLIPRSSHSGIGKIDMIGAIEQSSNIYFSILAAEGLEEPANLIRASRGFGFGEKTGIELPGEISGMLPDDTAYNKTGQYSLAIGQHTLVVTPLQTAMMLSAIANKGCVLKPKVVQVVAGQEPLRDYRDPFDQTSFPFQEQLASIGIHFPLFSATQSENANPYVWYSAPEVKRSLPFPDPVRDPLIEGLHRVIIGAKGTARPHMIRALNKNPEWMRHFQEIKDHFIGKTGTAEILYKQTIDSESEAKIQNHIWCAGVSFAPDIPQRWEHPELVVVVYLRFSEFGGKEAAPLATEMIKAWKEICRKHGSTSYIGMLDNKLSK